MLSFQRFLLSTEMRVSHPAMGPHKLVCISVFSVHIVLPSEYLKEFRN